MQRSTLLLVVLVALILIVPTSLYFLVFERPIKASPDALILSDTDVSGWETNETGISIGYGYSGNPPLPLSRAFGNFFNHSTAFAMDVAILTFGSTGAAHVFFRALAGNVYDVNQSVQNVEEARVTPYVQGIQNRSNLSHFQTGFFWSYEFRIANVIGIITFGQIAVNEPGPPPIVNETNETAFLEWWDHEKAVQPPTQEWMDQIVSSQVEKIQQFNFHL